MHSSLCANRLKIKFVSSLIHQTLKSPTSVKIFLLSLTFFVSFISSCQKNTIQENEVTSVVKKKFPAHDENILFHGRIDFSNPQLPKLFWPGSGFTLWFEGTSIEVILDDLEGSNYYNAIIDDDFSKRTVINCIKGTKPYVISNNLTPGIHKLQLLRRTDSTTPQTIFKGVNISQGGKIISPQEAQPELKIEFYGDSITSGHGNLDETRENNDDRSTWDNYQSYAAMIARELNADLRCISMSGIGVMISWYPLIMPQVYDRINPNSALPKNDFTQWQPDVVVINLLQNDDWLINNLSPIPNTKDRIKNYADFVRSIRDKYEYAIIVCTLGNMNITREGSPWPEVVEAAVDSLDDPNVFFTIMPYKNTGGHPTVSEHRQMADLLTPFIQSKM